MYCQVFYNVIPDLIGIPKGLPLRWVAVKDDKLCKYTCIIQCDLIDIKNL